MANSLDSTKILFGKYKCVRCGVEYIVNRADTWNRCTPELCHNCAIHENAARLDMY